MVRFLSENDKIVSSRLTLEMLHPLARSKTSPFIGTSALNIIFTIHFFVDKRTFLSMICAAGNSTKKVEPFMGGQLNCRRTNFWYFGFFVFEESQTNISILLIFYWKGGKFSQNLSVLRSWLKLNYRSGGV